MPTQADPINRDASENSTGTAAPALCPICRYDRSSIPHEQPCPECGTDIPGAHRESLLANAPPPIVRSIRRGAVLTLACIPARLVALAVAGSLVLIDRDAATAWFLITVPLVSIASSLGWFWMAVPHRPIQRALPEKAARLSVRIVAVLTIAAAGGFLIAVVAERAIDDQLFESFLVLAMPVALLHLWVALAFIGVRYTRELARRTGSMEVAASANNLLKYTIIASMSLTFGIAGVILTSLIPLLLVFAVPLAVPYLFFLGLLVLFALIAGARLHLKLARAVTAAARSATLSA